MPTFKRWTIIALVTWFILYLVYLLSGLPLRMQQFYIPNCILNNYGKLVLYEKSECFFLQEVNFGFAKIEARTKTYLLELHLKTSQSYS